MLDTFNILLLDPASRASRSDLFCLMHGNGLDKLIQNNLIDYFKFISEHTEHSKHILETTQFPQQGQLPYGLLFHMSNRAVIPR